MKQGRDFEKLIHHIERVTCKNDDVTVESPKRLRDISTGRLREHDVVVTVRQAHHTLTVAIECRERSRPIGVSQIEAFAQKCAHTGVNHGVVVASNGFCKTALQKASALGIRCMGINELNKLDWFIGPQLLIGLHRQATSFDIEIVPDAPGMEKGVAFSLHDENGAAVTEDLLKASVNKVFKGLPVKLVPGEHQISFKTNVNGLYLLAEGTAEPVRARELLVDVTYTVTRHDSPLTMGEYKDASSNEVVSEFISGRVDVGAVAGKVLMTRQEGCGIKIMFVPDDRAAEPEQ